MPDVDASFADPGYDRTQADAVVTIDIAALVKGGTLELPVPVGMRYKPPARLHVEAVGEPRAWFRVTSEDYDTSDGLLTVAVYEISDDVPDLEVTQYDSWNVTLWDFGGPLTARQAFATGLSGSPSERITVKSVESGGSVIELDVQTGKQFPIAASVDLFFPNRPTLAALARVVYYEGETLRVKIEKDVDIVGNSPNEAIIVEIVDPGSGYAEGDTITLANGTVLTNLSVTDPYDTLTEVEITTPGDWATLPSNPVSQVSTSGSGTGATFNVTTAVEQDECLIELIDRAPPGIPLYQLNGLRVTVNGSDPDHDIDVSKGSVRDSTDTVDLVLESAITKRLDASFTAGTNQGAQVQSANLQGTVTSSGTTLNGSGAAEFTTDFTSSAVLDYGVVEDFVQQVQAVTGDLSTAPYLDYRAIVEANSTRSSVVDVVSSTELTTQADLGASTSTYKRGGYVSSGTAHYFTVLARKDADGSTDIIAVSGNGLGSIDAAGIDLPAGYTYYRVLGVLETDTGAIVAGSIYQPLLEGEAGLIGYDNGASGLSAENVQDAIDELAAAVGGAASPEVLDSDTFSGASTVDIFFPAGYTAFQKLVLDFKFTVGTDAAELFARLSTAASFLSGASDYRWWHETRPATTGVATITADSSDSEIELCLNVEATAGGGSLTITIRNPTSTADNPSIETVGRFVNSTLAAYQNLLAFGEFRTGAQDTDGIQLLPSTGTISGSWVLTGYP